MKIQFVRNNGRIIKFGFMSKTQLPLFMVWEEEWCNGEVVFGYVLFNSIRYIGI